MSTNKIVLKDVDQQMADFVPTYNPLVGLFLPKSQQYSEVVGQLNFKRLEAVGDIRSRDLTPKDTDIKQISVVEKTKVFKKYFKASQYVESNFQEHDRVDQIIAQVLDEQNKHADELLFLGEGTAANNVVNNGLFWSADPNYVVNGSAEVDTDADAGGLIGLHSKIMEQAEIANDVDGRKLVIYYGSTVISAVNGLFAASSQSFKSVMGASLGANYSQINLPSGLTPASNYGFLIINMDQIKLHLTTLPKLMGQGVNEEKMHSWHNFVMGSMMAEVLAYKGIIKQPITFEA